MNLLVLLMGDDADGRLREAIAGRDEAPARIHVVAPAMVGAFDWLATAEDDAHRQAEARVLAAEWTLADAGEIDGEGGDVDPVQAVEDALRAFPADEILIAGSAADVDVEAALRRFGLPVSRVEPPPGGRHWVVYRALRGLAAGRDGATPFVLFVGVNAAFLLAGLLLSLVVLLILWVIGAF